MKLASGVAPIKKYLDSGVNVCLGTDNIDNLDLFSVNLIFSFFCFEQSFFFLKNHFQEMKISGLLAKIKENSGQALSAYQILSMATINGAKALGLSDKIGSLEKGKVADFIAVKMECEPVYNPINSLVYVGLGINKVTHSWVAGKILLDNGKLTTIDLNNLEKRVNQWREKIISTLNQK